MAAPEQGHSGPGIPHFKPEVREAACEHYFVAYFQRTGVCLNNTVLPRVSLGCKGDAVLADAWQTFYVTHTCDGRLRAQERDIDKKAFTRLLRDWFAMWSESRSCPHAPRRKAINLSDDELAEMAHLLTTPLQQDGEFIRFENIDTAATMVDRVRQLYKKSRATSPVLHQHLVQTIPSFQYGPEDRSTRLCPSTLKARRSLADVWAGRTPWIRPAALKVVRTSARLKRKMGAPLQQADAQQPSREVYWKPAWFGQHTFMLDATSFSDKEGPIHSPAPHVYYNSDDVYGPSTVEPDKSISQSTHIMVYCVIHKHLGLVVGPDIMYTGTKLKTSTKPKEQHLADEGIKTWYSVAISCSESLCVRAWTVCGWVRLIPVAECRRTELKDSGELWKLDTEYGYESRGQSMFTVCSAAYKSLA